MRHLQAQRNRSCDYSTDQSIKHHLWKYKQNITSAAENQLPNMHHPTKYMNPQKCYVTMSFGSGKDGNETGRIVQENGDSSRQWELVTYSAEIKGL